ncbi:MAG TPA: hypothetical protein VGH63_09575, partial [Polyangia bacterium]
MSLLLSGLYWIRILGAFASLTERSQELEVTWIPPDEEGPVKDEPAIPEPPPTPEHTKEKI